MEVECMLKEIRLERRKSRASYVRVLRSTHVAYTPGNGALFGRLRLLIGLTLDACMEGSVCIYVDGRRGLTQIHDVIPANGTIVDHNVPSPESDGVPLLIIVRELFARRSRWHLTFLTVNLGPSSLPPDATALPLPFTTAPSWLAAGACVSTSIASDMFDRCSLQEGDALQRSLVATIG